MFKLSLYKNAQYGYFLGLKFFYFFNEQLVKVPELTALRLSHEYNIPIKKCPY